MKLNLRKTLVQLSVASLAAFGAAGCGDQWQTNCATGTKVDPANPNTCIPDGSVVCGQGTSFNAATGTCDPNGDLCPEGTVLINNECVTDAQPDAEEAAEPNDAGAGDITVPAVGDDGFVIHGCITPQDDNATADIDPWTLTVTEPTLLEITADGIGGLSAGFVVQPSSDPMLAALNDNGWVRFGVNLSGDTSSRQVFLPTAGTYVLAMSDSRQLFLQEAVAGSDKTCYFTTIKHLAIPEPTPITSATTTGTVGGEVKFYSAPALADGDLVFTQLDMPSAAANASLVVQVADDYLASNDEGTDFFGQPTPAAFARGGWKASDSLVFAVDSTYNYALAPAEFTLNVTKLGAAGALPATSGSVNLTQGDGTLDTYDDIGLFWFDVDAGDVVNFDVAFDTDSNFLILGADLGTIYSGNVSNLVGGFGDGLDTASAVVSSQQGWYRFPAAGRYYLAVYSPTLATGETVKITVARAKAAVTNLVFGTPATNQALGALNANFFNFSFTNQTWIEWNASSANFNDAIEVTTYASTAAGLLDVDAVGTSKLFDTDGTGARGTILAGTASAGFVRVADSGTPAANETFTLGVVARAHTALGNLSSAAPITKTGEDLGGAGKYKLYFVRAVPGDQVTLTVHPTSSGFNPTVTRLDVNEGGTTINAAGPNGDEELVATVTSAPWIAFKVAGNGNSTGTYDLALEAVSPVPYSIAPGTLAFTDICTGSNALTFTATGNYPADDDGISDQQTLPFAFQLFGEDVTKFTVSTNGFISFADLLDSAATNEAIPTDDAANGIFAPYWDDLGDTVVCLKSEATKVTIQWTGHAWDAASTAAQFQVVLHSDGKVDYIYGADHALDGDAGTVGAENLSGTFGHQIVFETPNTIKPSTSRTLTPMP